MHRLITKRGTLVSAEDLLKAFNANSPSLRVLNTTVGRPIADMNNDAVYSKERIPGSTLLNIDLIADKSLPGISHQTPKEKEWN